MASVRERAAAFDEFAAKNEIAVPRPTIVTSLAANLMKINEMKQLVSFAKSQDAFGKHHDGKIDILVNNAGTSMWPLLMTSHRRPGIELFL